ncbi:OmpA family protein [Pseudooceanicola sp. C21-150M6]|uniref:OmpA family protein n=1 Tax=Pseudooceanicola sp. C21-150M6 TaxID=3434355 RepID=UPI003D7F3BA4
MYALCLARSLALAALMAGAPVVAVAQSSDASTLSQEELMQRFQRQKTRGLLLAPKPGTETETAETTQTAETTYVQVDPQDQVNIRISFDFDSAALRDDEKPKLTTLCDAMKAMDGQVFRIVGHTDSAGSASYNENLSKLRAEEVKRFMVGSCGIAAEMLQTVGAGESFPVNEADPRADENRRVEFQALS